MGRIHQIWKKRKSILTAIKNNLFKKEHIELIADSRLQICFKCPHIDHTGDKCFVIGTVPCCGLCGCKLSWKVRSLSEECADVKNKRWTMLLTPDEEYELLPPNNPE